MQTVTMPQASNSMEEGTVVRWLRQEGEPIAQGEILLEIETDKATVEVESPETGVVRAILAAEGAMVPIHAPLAILAGADEKIDTLLAEARAQLGQAAGAEAVPSSAAQAAPAAAAPPAFQPSPVVLRTDGRAKASPAARKAAAQHGVDLLDLRAGSGPGGRILSTDVAAFAPSAAGASGAPGRPLTGMRRAIARNLTLSKQTIPHWYLTVTVDADPMLRLAKAGPGRSPFGLNDVLVAAAARVMMEMPDFRGRLENDRIVDYPTANVGIAVGTDEALVVPVVVGADALSLRQLGATTRRLIAAAREGKVQNSGQGQLTISNLGMFGIDEFVAIINPPETAILAVGAVREDVIVRGGTIRAGRVMTITISSDHRVIDGTRAARFMARLRELLENPGQLLAPPEGHA